jgi:hypothetical protein
VDCVNRGQNYHKRRRLVWIVSKVGTTKRWVCRVAEKDSDWLGSSTRPHTKEVWTGMTCLVVQQGFDLLWVQVTTSAECKKVSGYSLFLEGTTNAAGKEPIEALVNL